MLYLMIKLGKITVCVLLPLLSLKVFLLDENVDTLLDDWNLGLEPKNKVVAVEEKDIQENTLLPRSQLVENFSHEVLMLQSFPGLHDSDNRGLDQEFPVLLNVFVSHLHLLALLGLHGNVDVDPELLVLVLVEQVDGGAGLDAVLVRSVHGWPHQEF